MLGPTSSTTKVSSYNCITTSHVLPIVHQFQIRFVRETFPANAPPANARIGEDDVIETFLCRFISSAAISHLVSRHETFNAAFRGRRLEKRRCIERISNSASVLFKCDLIERKANSIDTLPSVRRHMMMISSSSLPQKLPQKQRLHPIPVLPIKRPAHSRVTGSYIRVQFGICSAWDNMLCMTMSAVVQKGGTITGQGEVRYRCTAYRQFATTLLHLLPWM